MSKNANPYVTESKSITFASRVSQFLIAGALLVATLKVAFDYFS